MPGNLLSAGLDILEAGIDDSQFQALLEGYEPYGFELTSAAGAAGRKVARKLRTVRKPLTAHLKRVETRKQACSVFPIVVSVASYYAPCVAPTASSALSTSTDVDCVRPVASDTEADLDSSCPVALSTQAVSCCPRVAFAGMLSGFERAPRASQHSVFGPLRSQVPNS